MMFLPNLPSGGGLGRTQAWAINNCGEAIGSSRSRAVLWTFPVPTAESRTLALKGVVDQLVAGGELSAAESRRLHAALDGALRSLEREDEAGAARMLGLFAQHVETLMKMRNAPLDPENGRLLIRRAERIVELFLSGSRPSCD